MFRAQSVKGRKITESQRAIGIDGLGMRFFRNESLVSVEAQSKGQIWEINEG
jgi:hypothetical protein